MSLQALNTVLKDIYQATIQSEDELNHTSATLIMASIFQFYSTAPRYASYANRVASFGRPSRCQAIGHLKADSIGDLPVPLPSASEFAAAGFFHTGRADETVCGLCGLGLRDWQPVDEAHLCHALFSAGKAQAVEALFAACGQTKEGICTALPCLYLAAHRLLTSELPLARKKLVPRGPLTAHSHSDSSIYLANLSDRLRAVANSMRAPPHPEGWPVENALALGYPGDLIALALWKCQAHSISTHISVVPSHHLKLAPQDTTILLRTMLRLQESGLDNENETYTSEYRTPSEETVSLLPVWRETPSEDSSLEGLQALDFEVMTAGCVRLPGLRQLLDWWCETWPEVEPSGLQSRKKTLSSCLA